MWGRGAEEEEGGRTDCGIVSAAFGQSPGGAV